MKKTYMNPDIQVITMKVGQLMNGSPLSLNPGSQTGSGKLSSENAEGDAMGRFGIFDDDEFEE